MKSLTLIDLEVSKELDSEAMVAISGGRIIGFPGFSLHNRVNDVDALQVFGISTLSGNGSVLNAGQGNVNLNGMQHANQDSDVYQESYSYTGDIGNIYVS